jgi:hypothetical protein
VSNGKVTLDENGNGTVTVRGQNNFYFKEFLELFNITDSTLLPCALNTFSKSTFTQCYYKFFTVLLLLFHEKYMEFKENNEEFEGKLRET